jgi:hypothetical protein
MRYIQIETNDGEKRVLTQEDHLRMIEKWGKDLPYVVLNEIKNDS